MRRRLAGSGLALTVAAAVGAGGAAPVAAQPAAAPAGATPAGCTYDTCALRRERVFFADRLVAGTRGTVAARPRFLGAFPLDSIVRGVPEAEADARVYRREQRSGSALTLVGTVLGLAAVIDAVNRSGGECTVVAVGTTAGCTRGWTARNTALIAGSASFNLLGAWRLQIADRRLNRALWWYNRALPR
jgi:hypothetical protein